MKVLVYIFICLISVLFGIGSFIVNHKEKKALKQDLKETQDALNSLSEHTKKYVKEQKENEEKLQNAMSGNNADSFNSSVELMHNIAQKGKNRNKA